MILKWDSMVTNHVTVIGEAMEMELEINQIGMRAVRRFVGVPIVG